MGFINEDQLFIRQFNHFDSGFKSSCFESFFQAHELTCITATSLQEGHIMATTPNIEILKVALRKEIQCISSEVAKTVMDSVNKKVQSCIQSWGHQLKNVVIQIYWGKFVNLWIIMRPCFFKSVYKTLSYQFIFRVPFLLITLFKKTFATT